MSEVNVLCIYMDWYSSTLVVSWLSVYSFFGQLRQYFENRMLDHLIYFEVDLSLLFVFIFYYSNHILLYVMIWAEKYPLSRYKYVCLPACLFICLSVCLSVDYTHKNLTPCSKSANKPSTSCAALLVPSCQQVWKKLLITCK